LNAGVGEAMLTDATGAVGVAVDDVIGSAALLQLIKLPVSSLLPPYESQHSF